jgi:hypothetical protein
MPKSTFGTELMNRINSGELKKLPSEYVEKVKVKISDALSELLDMGARIRPLIVNGERVGWCRGVHLTERKILQRWSMNTEEFTNNLLRVGTTLSQEYIDDMSGNELQSLIRLLTEMADYDLVLFPYLFAFSTTSTSFRLWQSRGSQITGFENREVLLPDGAKMKILLSSDHARFWAAMCKQHEESVLRIENSINAALIIRPWVGKNADTMNNELHNTAKALRLDNPEPWETVVRLERKVDVNDGWAHAEDSLEGLKRELDAMMSNDRHERVMEAFERQQKEQADAYKEKAKKTIEDRGGPGITEKVEILTDKEVAERAKKLKRGKILPVPRDQRDEELSPQERMKKYK